MQKPFLERSCKLGSRLIFRRKSKTCRWCVCRTQSHSNRRNYMGSYLSCVFNVCKSAFVSLLQNASTLVGSSLNFGETCHHQRGNRGMQTCNQRSIRSVQVCNQRSIRSMMYLWFRKKTYLCECKHRTSLAPPHPTPWRKATHPREPTPMRMQQQDVTSPPPHPTPSNNP